MIRIYQCTITSISAERGKFEREQRKAARKVEIDGLRQAKELRMKDEAQKGVLQNNKIQAEVGAQLRAEREKFEREQRKAARKVEIDGLRQVKQNRNKDEAAKETLRNNKIQAEVAAQLRAERDKFARDQRNEANRVAIEGFRYYRNQERATAKAAEDRDIQDYKTKSLVAAGVKRDRDEAEKSMRSHMLRADADGKREMRANVSKPSGAQGVHQAGSRDSAAEKALREKEEAALRELAVVLAKEDLIDHLEVLVENGCMRIEDLALFDEKDIANMAPKVVHRRKLLSLHKRVVKEMERQAESGK